MERMLNYQMHCERLILNDLGDNSPNLFMARPGLYCTFHIETAKRDLPFATWLTVSMIGIDRLAV